MTATHSGIKKSGLSLVTIVPPDAASYSGRWIGLNPIVRIVLMLSVLYLAAAVTLYFRQRSMLFFPTHSRAPSRLAPWMAGTQTIGYCREVPHPRTIWLMTHGNAGQAADREYVLTCLSALDSLYVLEYPGYGLREGRPTLQSINRAAADAYQLLRLRNPHIPVCAIGESIGSGPACALAREQTPPDKIVLIVPFDTLAHVAASKFPILPIRLMLRDPWDNIASLAEFTGPVDIFGAFSDAIIPIRHAKALADRVPNARLIPISGGHNDWSESGEVRIER